MRIKSFPKPSYLLNSTNRVDVDPTGVVVTAAATPRADGEDEEGSDDDVLMIRPMLLPDVVVVQARVRQLKEERIE